MPESNELYITVQKGLVDLGYLAAISEKALKVYIALCSFKDWETRNCWPSVESLRRVTGLCKPSVTKGAQELEKLGLIRTWRFRKQEGRMFKKFYHIKETKDLCPNVLDKCHRPPALDKNPPQRDEKGRFVGTKSNDYGPSKANAVGSLKANGVGLSKANGIGQELISLNYNHRTKVIEQGKHGLRPLSFEKGKEKEGHIAIPVGHNETKPKKMTLKEEKEAVRELIKTMGEEWTRSYLIKCGRNSRLVDEVNESEVSGKIE